MKLYADRPLHATNQLLGDGLALAWRVFWTWLASKALERVAALGGPGAAADRAGPHLARTLGGAARRVDDIPLAGDTLRAPFDQGAGAGRDLASAARAYQDSVTDLARFATIATVVIPVLLVLVVWLPRRAAWIRAASAASRLLKDAGDSDRGTDLLALRALVHQPLTALAGTPGLGEDPAGGWRERDRATLEALADLELRGLGLRATRPG